MDPRRPSRTRPRAVAADDDPLRTTGGVGDIFDAIRTIATDIGFDKVTTQIGRHPKVRLRSTFLSGAALQVKVEMNTFERSPARPTVTRPFTVDSPWFTGHADVATFALGRRFSRVDRRLQISIGNRHVSAARHAQRRSCNGGDDYSSHGGWTSARAIQQFPLHAEPDP